MATQGSMLKLWEYVDDYQAVLSWMEEQEDQIRDAGGVLPVELETLLDQIETDLTEKVKRTALVARNLEANARAAKLEAERLSQLCKSYARQAKALKAYLKLQLQRAGIPKLETDTVRVRIQASSPGVHVRPGADIPEAYRRVKVEFDARAALEALRRQRLIPNGIGTFEVVDGLVVKRGTHLRIY